MSDPEPRLLRELHLAGDEPVAHVASGSGLEVVDRVAFVVADDLHHLAAFDLDDHSAPGRAIRAFAGDLPSEHAPRKAAKPDIEAIALVAGAPGARGILVGLPSGSTDRRTRGFALAVGSGGAIAEQPRMLDVAPLLAELERHVHGECNLEGAACLDGELVLALRGVAGVNALARVELARVAEGIAGGRLDAAGLRSVEQLDLGGLDGVALGITDLAVVDGELLATAAAEDTDNAYDDGAVVGSAVAWLTPGMPAPAHLLRLPAAVGKVEGIAQDRPGRVLLVTDDDDPVQPSRMYELQLPR